MSTLLRKPTLLRTVVLEGDPRLTDARTPTAHAHDYEATGAVAAHEAEADPHPDYLLESDAATALALKADLVGGVLPTSQLPALAVTEFLGSVANQSAMLALSGQKGDWCIRSDVGQVYVITGADPSLLASWTALAYPTSPVSSVNGETGVVVLSPGDVGADPAGTAAALVDDLSGVTDAAAARTNLGLGSAAVADSGDFEAAGAVSTHTGDTSDAHDASAISVDASGFNGNLTTSDDTVQKVAQKVDDLALGGSSLDVRDEGSSLTSAATRLDFVGAGVTATEPVADQIKVQIDGFARRSATANAWHWPIMNGDVASFGDYQRCYFIPFVGSGNTFDRASVYADVIHASGLVRIGVFTDPGDGTLTRVQDFGTVAANASPGIKTLTISPWATIAGANYLIAVTIQGNSAVKLRGGDLLPPAQSFDKTTYALPAAFALYEGSISGAYAATSYAPFGGLTTVRVPWVALRAQ